MDAERQRQISAQGGRAAHQKGTAHEFDSEEAREAGRKGGQASGGSRRKSAAVRAGATPGTGEAPEKEEPATHHHHHDAASASGHTTEAEAEAEGEDESESEGEGAEAGEARE